MNLSKINSDEELQRMKKLRIRQSNVITSGKVDYTACQMDIMFMVMASLNNHDDEYLIHLKDIELITGRKWNYQQYKNSSADILGRVYTIETPDSYTQCVLFQAFEYKTNQGTVRVKLAEKGKELLLDLKNNFTSLELKSVLSCSSKYAKRIYGLCCQWRTVGFREYDLKEFKTMLGLIDEKTGKEQFREVNALRKKILDIAKEQINKNTDIRFDYKLEKKFHSRSFNTIKLYINIPTLEQLRLEFEQSDIDFNKSIDYQRDIKYIMAYGLTEKQAEQILKNGKISDFDIAMNETKTAVKTGKIDNHIAYLCGALKNKKLLD